MIAEVAYAVAATVVGVSAVGAWLARNVVAIVNTPDPPDPPRPKTPAQLACEEKRRILERQRLNHLNCVNAKDTGPTQRIASSASVLEIDAALMALADEERKANEHGTGNDSE